MKRSLVFLLMTLPVACGDTDGDATTSDGALRATADAALMGSDGGVDASDGGVDMTDSVPADATAASCATPCIVMHPELDSPHVASLDGHTHNSNPPSSGPHCGSWPRWGVYDQALPRCNYLHGLEHGAVLVAYQPSLVSAEDKAALESVVKAFKDPNPSCTKPRAMLTPDPLLPAGVPIAAAAWRWTFHASRLSADERAALAKFLADHAAQGPEEICTEGSVGSPR